LELSTIIEVFYDCVMFCVKRPLSPESDLNSDINSCPLGQERILSCPHTNTHWASHIWAQHTHARRL